MCVPESFWKSCRKHGERERKKEEQKKREEEEKKKKDVSRVVYAICPKCKKKEDLRDNILTTLVNAAHGATVYFKCEHCGYLKELDEQPSSYSGYW